MKKKKAKKKTTRTYKRNTGQRNMSVLMREQMSPLKPHPHDRRTMTLFMFFILGTSKDKINPKSGVVSGDDMITDDISEGLSFNSPEEVTTKIKALEKEYPNYTWTRLTRSVI